MTIEVLQKPRQSGKSRHCIEWFLKDPVHRAILCPTHEMAANLRHAALRVAEERFDADDIAPLIYPIAESIVAFPQANRLRGKHKREVVIDQADDVLQGLVGTMQIKAVTFNA